MAKKRTAHDIIIFGATSFVGKILCRYLLAEYGVGGSVKWAIAGRSEGKLGELKSALGADAEDLQALIADAASDSDMNTLCGQTAVIVSTVGPYALYGEPLVKACAESGTHYCDLTGEPQWIRQMIHRYETVARTSGARIVHSCGFDSIPSDLGVYFLQEQVRERFGEPCDRIRMRVKRMKGAMSGGTAASIMNAAKEAVEDPALRKIMADPYSLCPEGHGGDAPQPDSDLVKFETEFSSWSAPFVMAAINTRIVHRSNALFAEQGKGYGENFRYDEAVMTGSGFRGGATAFGLTAAMGGFLLGAALPPTRWLLEQHVLPSPGEGPSEEQQLRGSYDLRFLGATWTGDSLAVRVTGDRDPGYGSTAKILGEAAVCLAQDIEKTVSGGFWTPATVLGGTLISRLEQRAGLSFEVLDN